MSTNDRSDDPTVVIAPVDEMPPDPPEIEAPASEDAVHDPMPLPIESLRSVKAFLRPAAPYLLGAVAAVALLLFAFTIQEPIVGIGVWILSLLAIAYVGCYILRYWLEWQHRPYSLTDPGSCVLTFVQKGYVLLKWTGMDDSPPDSFRLGDYDVITPPKSLAEQTLFRRSNTLWLLKEGEEKPPPNRIFRDMLFVEEIRAAWEWYRLQPVQQQDDVIDKLTSIDDRMERLVELAEGLVESLVLRDEAINLLLGELRAMKSQREA